MPFNETAERHFYFGDTFFKSYVGVFDQESGQMGMAVSSRAPAGVTITCPGTSCDPAPTPEPEPPTPTPEPDPPAPTPDPDPPAPTPTPSDGGDDHLMWLWIVIGLSVLLLIVLAVAVYYCRKAQKKDDLNAIIYAQTPGEATPFKGGNNMERDLEREIYGSQPSGQNGMNPFSDHADMMRESGQSLVANEVP